MNLQEIRKKYPQYNDVEDDVLVDALHRKHYKDLPLDVFQEAIGYTPPAPEPGLIERGMGAITDWRRERKIEEFRRGPEEPYQAPEVPPGYEDVVGMGPPIAEAPKKDADFQKWVKSYGIEDPDDPRHFYDYRAAFEAGIEPTKWRDLPQEAKQKDIEQGREIPLGGYMWPDEFKREGHPIPPEEGKRPSGAERYFGATTEEKLINVSNAFTQGVFGVAAGIPESIAIAAKAIDDALPEKIRSYPDKETKDLATYRAGQAIRDLAEEIAPRNSQLQESFIFEVLPQAFGSMAGFMAATVAGGAANAPAWLTAAGAGIGLESSALYREAKAYGASEEDARWAATLGIPGGASEAVPIARIFRRFDKATGGTLKKLLVQAAKGGVEEAAQETFQRSLGNATARALYDENREILEGIVEEGGAGGIVGFVTNLIMGSLGVKARMRPALAPKVAPEAPPEVPPKPVEVPKAEVPEVKEPPIAKTLEELRAIEKEFPKPRKVEEFPVRPPKVAAEVAPEEPITPEPKVEVPGKPLPYEEELERNIADAKKALQRIETEKRRGWTSEAKLIRKNIKTLEERLKKEPAPEPEVKPPAREPSTKLDKAEVHRDNIQSKIDDIDYALSQKQKSFAIERSLRETKKDLESKLLEVNKEIAGLKPPTKEPEIREVKRTEAGPYNFVLYSDGEIKISSQGKFIDPTPELLKEAKQALKVEKPPAKEPWEMSQAEFKHEALTNWYKDKKWFNQEKQLKNIRKEVVSNALEEGKPVPKEVLADYPDLGKLKPTTIMDAELRAKKKQWAEGVAPEKIKGGLFEEARKQEALFKPKKVKPPEKAKTFIEWVRRAGGIWDKTLTGEMREFTPKESGVWGLVKKGGQPFDTLLIQAIEDGWLPEGSTDNDFYNMLRDDVLAQKGKKPRMRPFSELEIAKEIEKEFAAAEPQTQIDASAAEAHDATLSFMGTGQIPRVGTDMVDDILHHTGIKDKDPDGITITNKDLRDIYTYLQMPDDLRRTFPELDPTIKVQEAREVQKASLDSYFAKETKPYFSLKGKDLEAVDKVLIEGNLASTDYTDKELETVFSLTNKQIEGYKAIRANLNHAGNILVDKMEELGVSKKVTDDFKKRIKGYVPHKWHGDWAIVVKDPKDKTEFMTATNYFDRFRERDRVKNLYPKSKVLILQRKKIPYEAFQQAAPYAVQKMVDLAIEKAKLDKDVGDAMSQALSDLYKSKGFGMHFIKRKGTPGYKEELTLPLAEYFSGFTGYITKMEAIKAFPEALKTINPQRTPNLYKYGIDYINYVTGEPLEFKTAKNLAYFWYLFGNIKSASLNLTQNFVLGWPVLSKETNLALPKMMQAMARTASYTLTKGEKDFIATLEKTGHLDPKMTMEISGIAGGPLTKQIRGLGGKVMSLADVFRHAERFNRRSMAVAVYDSGIRDIDKAARLIKDAHFWYGKGNRPRLARGVISPLLTFRTWYINYITFLKNQIKAGEMRPLAKSLFALIMLGGLAAIPGYEQIKKQYTKFFGIDPETEARKVLGKRMGRDLIHGMPSEIGVEFSGSVGMGDIIPTNLKEIGGVFADIPARVGKVTRDMYAGDYKRALEDAAPESLRNPLYAYRLYTRGATGRGGRPILDLKTSKPLKITKGEAYRKTIGYYPIRLAEQYGISETLRTIREQRMEKKREWADRYRIALLNKDMPEKRKIMDELDAWNLKMRKRHRWEDQIRKKEFKQMLELRERPLGKPPKYMRPKLQKLRKQY